MRVAGAIAVSAFLTTTALIAPVQAQSLPVGFPSDADVITALDAYPGVAAADAYVDAAQSQSDILRAGPYEFTLSGSYARRTVEREGRFNESEAALSRTIRLPGKWGLDRKAGALGVEVAENQRDDVRHQAAILLSTLWHDWLEAGALVKSDERAVEMQSAAAEAIRRRTDLKDASDLDLDQAQAAHALANAQLADSQARLEKARATLAATFPEIPLSDEAPTLPEPMLPTTGLDRLRDLVITRSHEIQAATREAERLSVVARRAKFDRVPDPTVGVRVFNERGGLEQGVGVQLSIPLGWSLRRATASRASAEATAAGYASEEVRRAVQATADADATDVRTRVAAWKSTAASARSTAAAADRTVRGHEMGAVDLSDLLFIQKQANDARRAEIGARSAASRALIKLLIDAHEIWVMAHGDAHEN